MRQVCILGRDRAVDDCVPGSTGEIEFDGVAVRYGLIETADPLFDPDAPENAHRVLIRVIAFSCNYRDRALMLRMAVSSKTHNYYVVGSDFVASVVAIGAAVADLAPGDRVIGNNAFPDSGVDGVMPGVVTNHASREFLVLHRAKLMRVPDVLTDSAAAGFSIGAQTAYAMVRRIAVGAGDRALVTAPRSNTSLFALAALRARGVEVWGLARSYAGADRLQHLGMSQILVIDPADPAWHEAVGVRDLIRSSGAVGDPFGGEFDAMIDPLADIYLDKAPFLLRSGGRYITCGLADQSSELTGSDTTRSALDLVGFATNLMVKNISVIGNCIGSASDLAAALSDVETGLLSVPVDSVETGVDVDAFLERTYTANERFGKVIFAYD